MTWQGIKRLIQGVVLGIVVGAIGGFSADWITTAGARDTAVREAWIAGQAELCAKQVQSARVMSGDEADITGYQGRSEREELASAFLTKVFGERGDNTPLMKVCADELEELAKAQPA